MIRVRYRLDGYGCFLFALMVLPVLAVFLLRMEPYECLFSLTGLGLILFLLRGMFGDF